MDSSQKQLEVYVLSDLHLEFYKSIKKVWRIQEVNKLLQNPPLADSDAVLILAGDIGWPVNKKGNLHRILNKFLIQMRTLFKYVIMVAGNHEYYSEIGLESTEKALESLCQSTGIVYLQCNSWIHPPTGVKFHGCTLWSQITPEAMTHTKDYGMIYSSREEAIMLHKRHIKWLSETLNKEKGPCVVVSHHAPSMQCIEPEYIQTVPDNTAYYTDLEHLIKPPMIAWICGHTHGHMAFVHNDINIIMNAIGYPREQPKKWYKGKRSGPYIIKIN
jgi:predicted phosphohydrolase